MAHTTIGTFLMYSEKDKNTWKKLADIKDYPDLGGAPERIQSTTLSNTQHTYENGVQDTAELQFTANYDRAQFQTLKTMQESGVEYDFGVWFDDAATYAEGETTLSPNEANSDKFTFSGKVNVYAAGGGVNAIRDMLISLSNSGDVKFTPKSAT